MKRKLMYWHHASWVVLSTTILLVLWDVTRILWLEGLASGHLILTVFFLTPMLLGIAIPHYHQIMQMSKQTGEEW